jgi:hypothetical protein
MKDFDINNIKNDLKENEHNSTIILGKNIISQIDFYYVLEKIFNDSRGDLPFCNLYKELADIYGYSTFNRTDLKNIVGNENIISKNIIRQFKPKNEDSSIPKEDVNNVKEDKEDKDNNIEGTNADEFYYCSKKNKIPTKDLIKKILEYFDLNNINEVIFEELYDYLRQVYHIKSFNRENLKKFLNINFTVKKLSIVELASKFHNKSCYYEQNIIKNRILIAESINVLGLDFIKYILKNDINYVFKVLNVIQDKSFLDVNFDKLKNTYDFLYAFLSFFSENESIEIFNNEEVLKKSISIFLSEYEEFKLERQTIDRFREAIERINPDNRNLIIKYILPYNLSKVLEHQGLILLSDLSKLTDEQILVLNNKSSNICKLMENFSFSIREVLSKSFIDIVTQKNKLGKVLKNWKMYLSVLSKRIEGKTLQAVGDQFFISRERVRQIEKKYLEVFNNFYRKKYPNLSNILRSYANNPNYITPSEIHSLIGIYSNFFIYLLKICNLPDIAYIEELDIFYFPQDDLDWYKELLLETARLPSIISKEEMEKIIDKMHNIFFDFGYEIPRDFCKKVMVQDYLNNNTFYSKEKLSLAEKYNIILRKYFTEGIHITNESDMEQFKYFYKKDFADDKLPINNRAIVSRISDIAVLCGRGTYKPKQEKYISDKLLEEIYTYIAESPRGIILINTIFYEFEDKLLEHGVNNKYFLQASCKMKCNG